MKTKTTIRPPWYSKPPKKRNKDWKLEERQLIYDMRHDGKPVAEIIEALGGEVTPTQVHNQARISKKSFAGKCFCCGEELTDEDIETQKSGRILYLCKRCQKAATKYKKGLRKKALKLGLCGICGLKTGRKALKGHTACSHCISATQRRRNAKGLCGNCGKNPIDKKRSVTLCATCLHKNAVYGVIRRRKR